MNSKTVRIKKICTILTTMIVGLTFLSSCSSEQNKAEPVAEESVEEVPEKAATEEAGEGASTAGLPHHLEECTAYSETFTHPMTGDELNKEVMGLDEDGLCKYKEEMPNGGLMECKFSKETRLVMAQYYKNEARYSSFAGIKITYKLNGKTVENPLDVVMNNGDCTISGY